MLKTVTKQLIILLITLFIADSLFPQSYNTQFYNESNGLFNSKVWSIIQDKSGRMWFGTRSGISVYDGLSWSGFLNTDSIGGYECFGLREDEEGNIKALFRNPSIFVATYTKEGWKRLPPSGFVTGNQICSFFVTGKSEKERVFVCTENDGIFWYEGNIWKSLFPRTDYGLNVIYSACPLGDSVLLATEKGLYFLTPSGEIKNAGINFPSNPRGIYSKKEYGNKFYAAGEDWFGFCENGTVRTFSKKIINSFDYNVTGIRIEEDKKAGFYLFNHFTLNYFSLLDTSVTRLRSRSGLITDGASCVFIDRENNTWIGSLRGANKISSRRFINYLDLFGEGDGEVSAMLEYEPGKIIFGGNNGYTMYDGYGFRYYPYHERSINRSEKERILDFERDSKNNIWIASTTGGFKVIDRNGHLVNYSWKIPDKERASSVIMDKDDNMWLVTNTGVYIYDGVETRKSNEFPPNYVIRKAFVLDDSTLGFATVLDGFYLKTKTGVTRYFTNNKESNSVFSLLKDRKGKLWVGTLAGLFELKNNTVQRAVLNNGDTIARPVYLLLEDKSGNLWIGTDFGVYKYNGKDIRAYSTKDGLAGNELNRSGGLVEKNGRVWFGTNFGASCYFEEHDNNIANDSAVMLNIFKITSSGKTYPNDADISLSGSMDDLTFYLSGCSFINEKENRITWMLEGADENWRKEILYQSGEILYTNLSPGDYRLRVRMRNANGFLGPETVSRTVTIEKPFFLRWWFIILAAAILTGVAYSTQNYFSQRKYNRFLQAEVNKATEELTEAERTYRETLLKEIHHRIKNNLQVVSSLLSLQSNTLKDKEVLEVLRESQNRIRSMAMIHEKLYQSKSYSSLDISSYIKGLVDYLKRSYMTNTSLVKIEVDIPELYLNADISVAIGLIINELVSNALKYAFPGNATGKINISVRNEGVNSVLIKLSDDGVGLDREPVPANMDTLGLRLVNMLVKQYDGEMKIQSDSGTSFEIILKHGLETPSRAKG